MLWILRKGNLLSEIYVISDTHFNHYNIVHKFGRVGEFQSVEEMNETLIDNWNNTVKPGDKVYHLGDFAFGPKTDIPPLIKRLNGRKRLIIGNHDDVKLLTPYFEKIMLWRMWKGLGLLFTHVPVHPSTLGEDRFDSVPIRNVHGHIHGNPSPAGNYRCVCVEQTDYRPVHIEDLKYKIGELK